MDEQQQAPSDEDSPTPQRPRAAWEQPSITELPKLTDLTLLTGSGIPGSIGGSSTVF